MPKMVRVKGSKKILQCNKKVIILASVSSTPISGGFNAAPKRAAFFFLQPQKWAAFIFPLPLVAAFYASRALP